MRPLVVMEPLVERGMAVPHLDRQIGTVEGEARDRYAEPPPVARPRFDLRRYGAARGQPCRAGAGRDLETIQAGGGRTRPDDLAVDDQVQIGVEIEFLPERLGA